ncbi:hypothetical protein [Bacillus sp. T33-2]|uniref:hypothetical protein n=1 Tax=Bacillus sp. T33-2 TaxID=2054168 RepID=UPI000C76A850|nr:hypothetical protein [Bacillus sp. T33-2]PLR97484.1 hypothetical protein CVD19_08320 [Bacillus sp. T33-2]
MTTGEINEILDKVKKGSVPEFYVRKEDFLAVRQVLVEREDFKQFHGIAQRGGDVIYQYTAKGRS